MYTLIPKRKNAFGIIFSSLFITCGIFLLAIGITKDHAFSSLFTLSSTACFVPGLLIAARYVFYSYEYIVDREMFTIKEKRWKKSVVFARIALHEIDELIVIENKKKNERIPQRVKKVYDYRPDLFPKKYHIIITRNSNYCEEGEEMHILVDLDDRMFSLMSKK